MGTLSQYFHNNADINILIEKFRNCEFRNLGIQELGNSGIEGVIPKFNLAGCPQLPRVVIKRFPPVEGGIEGGGFKS
jgi:hypothetical protein